MAGGKTERSAAVRRLVAMGVNEYDIIACRHLFYVIFLSYY